MGPFSNSWAPLSNSPRPSLYTGCRYEPPTVSPSRYIHCRRSDDHRSPQRYSKPPMPHTLNATPSCRRRACRFSYGQALPQTRQTGGQRLIPGTLLSAHFACPFHRCGICISVIRRIERDLQQSSSHAGGSRISVLLPTTIHAARGILSALRIPREPFTCSPSIPPSLSWLHS